MARRRAAARGLDIAFAEGEAAAMPFATGHADVVVSVFGAVFAPDAKAAAAEMTRVLAGDGRVVLTAWIPAGPIFEPNRVARAAVAQALGTPAGPAPFAWHEPDALVGLFASHGLGVDVEEVPITFSAASTSAYLEAEFENHPMLVAGRRVLEPAGKLAPLRARLEAILEEANEDPGAFRVTSRYIVAMATRNGGSSV